MSFFFSLDIYLVEIIVHTESVFDVIGEWWFKIIISDFFPILLLCQYEQDREYLSALSLDNLNSAGTTPCSFFNHSRNQEYLSAPGSYCLCQAKASSWSGDSVDTQDCYTQSRFRWMCKPAI